MFKRTLTTTLLVGLLSLPAIAKLKTLTDDELAQNQGQIFPSSVNERQATILMALIASHDKTTSLLTQKINARLKAMNLELVAEEAVRRELLRMNSVAVTDARLAQSLEFMDRMFLNKRLYDEAQLRDAQRRAIIQGFINAVARTDLQGNPSLNNAVIALGSLNPYALLSQYPNLYPGPNGQIVSHGNPNSPNINIYRSR